MNDWTQKIIAFLHDPPDKQLHRGGHEPRGRELLKEVFGQDVGEKDARWQQAKRADRSASAADRLSLEDVRGEDRWGRLVDFARHPLITHPLGADEPQPLDGVKALLEQLNAQQAGGTSDGGLLSPDDPQLKAIRGLLDALPAGADERLKYLALWRRLPDQLARVDAGGLGHSWSLLPADSRMPDHTLLDHLTATAALASALPVPALLVFSVGPVQDFIRLARRTQDLWMGSYLLAYLTWAAIRVVASAAGPDAIMYPALRGQPLADQWLSEQGVPGLEVDPGDLSVATFPNRFVALLHRDDAAALAGDAADEVRRVFEEEIAGRVYGWLPSTPESRQWQEQVRGWPHVYWAVHEWPAQPSRAPDMETSQDAQWAQDAQKGFRELFDPPASWFFDRLFAAYWQHRRPSIRIGTVYSLLERTAEAGHRARRLLRDQAYTGRDQPGKKCSLCGQRSAVSDGRDPDDYWAETATFLRRQDQRQSHDYGGLMAALKPLGGERLCALCAIKRFAQAAVFRHRSPELQRPFPSTSSVAAASFLAGVLEQVAAPPDREPEVETRCQALRDALRDFVAALDKTQYAELDQQGVPGPLRTGLPHTLAHNAIPHLDALVSGAKAARPELVHCVDSMVRYDGDLLFADSYTQGRFKNDYGLAIEEAALVDLRCALAGLRDAAGALDVDPPTRYYAVLMVDGDHMGRWLAGELSPRLREVLHPQEVVSLEQEPRVLGQQPGADGRKEWGPISDDPVWDRLMDLPRFVSPATHTTISAALRDFALQLVRWVIEELHPGRAVYAGGDDLLALLPARCALPAAQMLRALFSGQVQPDDLKRPAFERKCTGYLWRDGRPLKTMGPRASFSAGIVYAHHMTPLDLVLESLRQAVHAAKENYGRNAVVAVALKRSGETVRAGMPWHDLPTHDDVLTPPPIPRSGLADPVAVLLAMQKGLAAGALSGKLPYLLLDEAEALAVFLPGAAGGLPPDAAALTAELARLLKRQSPERTQAVDWQREEVAALLARLRPDACQAAAQKEWNVRLAELLTDVVLAAHSRYLAWHQAQPPAGRAPDADDPAPGTVELARWLLIGRFLTRAGKED